MSRSTARWEENRLMIRWYGSQYEDEEAWFFKVNDYPQNRSAPKPYVLVFEGYNQTMIKYYDDKPSAEEALAVVQAWQQVS